MCCLMGRGERNPSACPPIAFSPSARGQGAPAITDLIAGHVHAIFEPAFVVLPHIEAKKLVAIAVAAKSRTPELPDVPTAAEGGLDGLHAVLWQGVVAPSGTPPQIIEQLNSAINASLRLPEMKSAFAKLGAQIHMRYLRNSRLTSSMKQTCGPGWFDVLVSSFSELGRMRPMSLPDIPSLHNLTSCHMEA